MFASRRRVRGGGNCRGGWIAMNQRFHRNASAQVVVDAAVVAKQRKITKPHGACGEDAHANTIHENPEAVHGYLPDRVRGCCVLQTSLHCAACAARP